MTYLGVDLAGATRMAALLRRSAGSVERIEWLVTDAEARSQLSTGCALLLDQVANDLRTAALATERAVTYLRSFTYAAAPWGTSWWGSSASVDPAEPVIVPERTPVPIQAPHALASPAVLVPAPSRNDHSSDAARWNYAPGLSWNEVLQDASHNSYKVPGGLGALHSNGVRAFELDIHRGAPTDFTQWPAEVVEDWHDYAGGRPDDWRVYHFSGDEVSSYDYLSEGFAAAAAIDSSDPITIFIDNKDEFGGVHQPAVLDELIVDAFGGRVFGPGDLLARSPTATSLHEVVSQVGWPTAAELESRVIVVLTDNIDNYPIDSMSAKAFASTTPSFLGSATGMRHIPDPNIVVYNVHADEISHAEILAVHATGSLVRTYENPDCAGASIGRLPPPVNYRAIDIDGDDERCRPPAPAAAAGPPEPN